MILGISSRRLLFSPIVVASIIAINSISFVQAKDRTPGDPRTARVEAARQRRLGQDQSHAKGEGEVAGNPCGSATNDCCIETLGAAGCNNMSCCQNVCNCDPYCCGNDPIAGGEWDIFCATTGFNGNGCGAQLLCGGLCAGGCSGAAGDCCSAHANTGCEDGDCCAAVCGCDPFCCDTEWDQFCATIGFQGNGCGAQLLCGTLCGGTGCGAGVGDCCSAHLTTGCEDSDCCQDVCSCDPFCCNTEWDDCCSTNGGGAGCVPGCGAQVVCPTLCGGAAPPNNDCANAIVVTTGTTPFSTAGATTDGPLLPAACDEGAGLSFGSDVWFNFLAPVTGMLTADLCAGTDYDSRMAIYTGCGCPASAVNTAECDDDGCCGGLAACASTLQTPVVMGQCYKIRVGGFGAAQGPGELVLSVAGTMNCPAGTVTFIDPQNGTIDARQPNPVNSTAPAQGIQTFTVMAPVGADDGCFRMCETASTGVANSIMSVTDNGAGMYTVTLSRPITPGAVTRVSYTPNGGAAITASVASHPANVNADAVASPIDILRIIDCLNNVNPATSCPWGMYSRDIDHSGLFGSPDILRVIDLLNGADVFNPWNNTPLPSASCTP